MSAFMAPGRLRPVPPAETPHPLLSGGGRRQAKLLSLFSQTFSPPVLHNEIAPTCLLRGLTSSRRLHAPRRTLPRLYSWRRAIFMPIVPCAPYLLSQRGASPGRQQAHEEMYEGRTTTGVTIHPACQSTHAAVPPQSTLLSTVGNFPGKRRPSARVGPRQGPSLVVGQAAVRGGHERAFCFACPAAVTCARLLMAQGSRGTCPHCRTEGTMGGIAVETVVAKLPQAKAEGTIKNV